MADVMVEKKGGGWKKVFPHVGIDSRRAEDIVDNFNSKEVFEKTWAVQYEHWETPGLNKNVKQVE